MSCSEDGAGLLFDGCFIKEIYSVFNANLLSAGYKNNFIGNDKLFFSVFQLIALASRMINELTKIDNFHYNYLETIIDKF